MPTILCAEYDDQLNELSLADGDVATSFVSSNFEGPLSALAGRF
jgi:hypothetical protein